MSIATLLGKRKTSHKSDPENPRNPNPCHIEPFELLDNGMPSISPSGVSPSRKKESEDSPQPQKLHDASDEAFEPMSSYRPADAPPPVDVAPIDIRHPAAIALRQHEDDLAAEAVETERDYLRLVVSLADEDDADDTRVDETIRVCTVAEKTAADLQLDLDAYRQRATLLHFGNTSQLREPQYAQFDQFDPPATPWQN